MKDKLMEVRNLIKYVLSLAMVHAASGTLGIATFALLVKTAATVQHKQLSYVKFNRMLHSPPLKAANVSVSPAKARRKPN
jgi:hypothetical protein